jgi:hypothetical protein
LKCFIAYNPISVPVLPRPALQWIAIAPCSFSAILKKSYTIFSGGVDPSMKNRSEWFIPFFINLFLSYFDSFNLITLVTLKWLKTYK